MVASFHTDFDEKECCGANGSADLDIKRTSPTGLDKSFCGMVCRKHKGVNVKLVMCIASLAAADLGSLSQLISDDM